MFLGTYMDSKDSNAVYFSLCFSKYEKTSQVCRLPKIVCY